MFKFFNEIVFDFPLVVKEVSDMIFFFIYTTMGAGDIGARTLLNEFYTGIPIIKVHSIFKLWRINFWEFVGRHIFFYITTKLPFVSAPIIREFVSCYLLNFFMKTLLIILHVFLSCLVIPWCHWSAPQFLKHLMWPQGW